jgi:hypothetical protein
MDFLAKEPVHNQFVKSELSALRTAINFIEKYDDLLIALKKQRNHALGENKEMLNIYETELNKIIKGSLLPMENEDA